MQAPNPFRLAEEQYFKLRGQLVAGRITREQYEAALKTLMLEDTNGHTWSLGKDTAQWFYYDGAQWIQADPYTSGVSANLPPPVPPAPVQPIAPPELIARPPAYSPPLYSPQPYTPTPQYAAPAPTPPKKSSGCFTCRNVGCGCLGLILLIVLLAGIGYLAYTNGYITQKQILNAIGQGPATIEIDNFRDDAILVNITRADPVGAGTPTPTPQGFRLNPFDIKVHRVQEAGKYRVEFRTQRGNADLGSCTLTVRGGDDYQFVTLPERIAINRVNNPSNVGRDFVITTSSLCR